MARRLADAGEAPIARDRAVASRTGGVRPGARAGGKFGAKGAPPVPGTPPVRLSAPRVSSRSRASNWRRCGAMANRPLDTCRLQLVVVRRLCPPRWRDAVKAAIAGGADLVQLREK